MCEIKATGSLGDHELKAIPVLNPGDWFGKAWLLEIGGSYSPLFIVVEADSVTDAIDELADDETYGSNIIVDDADLGDYDWASKRFASHNTECADVRDTVREVGELAIQNAVRRRGHHRGPMAEFKRALALVRHVRQGGDGPTFASWF